MKPCTRRVVSQEGNFSQITPCLPSALVGCTRLSFLHADPTRVGRQHAEQARPLRGASGPTAPPPPPRRPVGPACSTPGWRGSDACCQNASDPIGCSAGAGARHAASDVIGRAHGHHIRACAREDPTPIGQSSQCQRLQPFCAERHLLQIGRGTCRGRTIYARLWRHSSRRPSRPLS